MTKLSTMLLTVAFAVACGAPVGEEEAVAEASESEVADGEEVEATSNALLSCEDSCLNGCGGQNYEAIGLCIDACIQQNCPQCSGGTTACNGQCVNTLTDDSNCGQCGNDCNELVPGRSGFCRDGACIIEK